MANKAWLPRSAAALSVLVLVGCGGGGGGGSSGLAPPPSTPVAITSSNQQQVSGTALNSAQGGTDVLGSASSTGVQTTVVSKPRVVTRTLQDVARHTKEVQAAPQTVTG